MLGCGAHVDRAASNPGRAVPVSQTVTLERLQALHAEGGAEALDRLLLPIGQPACEHWPLVQLPEHSRLLLVARPAGARSEAPKLRYACGVQDHEGRFIGIGEVERRRARWRRVFVSD